MPRLFQSRHQRIARTILGQFPGIAHGQDCDADRDKFFAFVNARHGGSLADVWATVLIKVLTQIAMASMRRVNQM